MCTVISSDDGVMTELNILNMDSLHGVKARGGDVFLFVIEMQVWPPSDEKVSTATPVQPANKFITTNT